MVETNRQKYNRKYGFPRDASHSKADISKTTGIPMRILNKSYDRGIGAWKTNIRSVRVRGTMKKDSDLRKFPRSARLPKEAWAYSRIYSMVMGGKADPDLQREIKELKKKKKI